MVLEPKKLNRISSVRIFDRFNEAITTINYEPTQVVFLGSNQGMVKAINFIPQQMSYVYLDLGQNEYCTIPVNNKNLRKKP